MSGYGSFAGYLGDFANVAGPLLSTFGGEGYADYGKYVSAIGKGAQAMSGGEGGFLEGGGGPLRGYKQSQAEQDKYIQMGNQAQYDTMKLAIDANFKNEQLSAQQGAAASSARASAARAAAGAIAAAARQEEQNRMKAAKKALLIEKGAYANALGYLSPFRDAATRLVPDVEAFYRSGMDTGNLLKQAVTSPQAMSRLNAAVPAYSIKVPKYKI